ncbi:MAG: cation:proton antiporter [Deltaproteobacteria bacterium]|nr:cation:proton antiporter [Deltaproteobacteria bacterium]
MKTVLALLAIALFAYLGAALYRIQRLPVVLRALHSSGLGFFAIGVALGPLAIGLVDDEMLRGLDVLIDLGVGWVGLLFGLQFHFQDLRRLPWRHYLGALSQAATTLVLCGLGLWLVFTAVPAQGPVWLLVLVLAAASSTSSPTATAPLLHDLAPRGPVTDALRLIASVDAVPAILLVGIGLCFAPAPIHPARYGPALDGLFWLGVALGLALALGALAHLITLYRYTDNQLLVIMLGLVVFCGGAADYLVLSPLFVNFLVGVVVANRSPARLRLLKALLSVEKPIFLVLVTLAGAMWGLPVALAWIGVAAFVLLRLAGKLVGGYAASAAAGLGAAGGWGLGPGLLAHGGMALAIALSFRQLVPGELGDVMLGAVVASMLATTLLGPVSLKWMLIRLGEARETR